MLSINNQYKYLGGNPNLSQAVGDAQDPSAAIIAVQAQTSRTFSCAGAVRTTFSGVNDALQMAGTLTYGGSTWIDS
jgi:hypothetical protein